MFLLVTSQTHPIQEPVYEAFRERDTAVDAGRRWVGDSAELDYKRREFESRGSATVWRAERWSALGRVYKAEVVQLAEPD